MLTGYLAAILEADENVLVGPSERLRPEIQILGETCIEFLVKGKVADEGAGKEQKERKKKRAKKTEF